MRGEWLLPTAVLVIGLFGLSGRVAAATVGVESWPPYQAIIWQPHRAEQCVALKRLGITAGAVIANRDNPADSLAAKTAPLAACGLGWYLENVATDFYSAYHRWSPDHPVNWRFAAVKKLYQQNPQDPAAFVRDPSLSDPAAWHKLNARLTTIVRAHRAEAPLFYNLGDEPGIGDLSAFWDFDFSPPSLAAMRLWLQAQYGTLAALNRQWGSHFARWDDVVPMTTAQAMRRVDENFSAWADFRTFMDVAFARAIRMGTMAIHAADPHAKAAIEGAQIPGWGGYDYTHLATAVDVMEMYDGGGNIEIARALNPKLVILTTSFDAGRRATHELWREFLRGSSGAILWDPKNDIVAEDGSIGARGAEIAAPLRELEAGIAALLRRSQRQTAPIALLYSPASFRTQWMLDWQPKSDAWSARDADSDYEDDSAVRSSMVGFLDALEHRGLDPQIVVSDIIEKGALRRGGLRVLILPQAIALSRRAAAEIRRFARDGGTVIADGEPGLFDQHSRRLAAPLLAQLFPRPPEQSPASQSFGKGRGVYLDLAAAGPPQLDSILAGAGVKPIVALSSETGGLVSDVEIYLWRSGNATILALQRDMQDGSGDVGATPRNDAGETVVLALPDTFQVDDLRQKKALGLTKRLTLTIDPVTPTILTLSQARRPDH